MVSLYQESRIFLGGFTHKLAGRRRELAELAAENLLRSTPETLAKVGYRFNYGAADGESLVTLGVEPLSLLLKRAPKPDAFVFHHTYADNGVMQPEDGENDPSSRARYLPAALLRHLGRDHITYISAFAGGCSGIFPLLISAAGMLGPRTGSIICLSADIRPPGTSYDAFREQSLFSDAAAGFHIGAEPSQYQLLGLSYYSTTRTLVLLIETVKRTVDMLKELVAALGLDLAASEVVFHYPNVFPKAWDMVTQYMQLPRALHVLDGLAERAHCLSADSMITLEKHYAGKAGRLHVVINIGAGIHLGICILREMGSLNEGRTQP